TPTKNVALAGRGMQEGRDDVASWYSDEFWFLLRSKGTCPSGIEDGRECGLAKEKEEGEKGMCLQHVETIAQGRGTEQHATSLRRKRRLKHTSSVQRGEVGIPRSI